MVESNSGILEHLIKSVPKVPAAAAIPDTQEAELDWKEHGIPMPVQTPAIGKIAAIPTKMPNAGTIPAKTTATGKIAAPAKGKKSRAKKRLLGKEIQLQLLKESAKDDEIIGILDRMTRDRHKRLDEASAQDDRSLSIIEDLNRDRKKRTEKFLEKMEDLSSDDEGSSSDRSSDGIGQEEEEEAVAVQKVKKEPSFV